MGSFFTNYHVRGSSTSAVRDAMVSLAESRAYVSPPGNGWITVYDEGSDSQDDAILRNVAAGLSKNLNTVVLAFLVHDSDVAMYWLYEAGRLRDEFNSRPDYFGEHVNQATRDRLAGKTGALLPLCKPGTTEAALEEVLHAPDGPPLMAEDLVLDLAKLLGIDETRACIGFGYFESEGGEMFPDIEEFEPIGNAERMTKAGSTDSREPAAQELSPQAPAAPLDLYPLGVGMMIHCWSSQYEHSLDKFAVLTGSGGNDILKQLKANFDNQAKRWLKEAGANSRPTFEELKTARNQGPDALAELLARRTPELLVEYASSAVQIDVHEFIAALLNHGLDPNARDHHGRTVLEIAAMRGTTSKSYQLLKAALEKN